VESELPAVPAADAASSAVSGMVWEDGLLIYSAGTALPDRIIDDAIRRSREERRNGRSISCVIVLEAVL
jgi:hypothetical protein